MDIAGKNIALFPSEEPGAPLVVLNAVEEEARPVFSAAHKTAKGPFSLAVITGLDWDEDLTPWPAPPAARGMSPCAGLADAYLRQLAGRILPAIAAALPARPAYAALAGYSLAGLFALYAPHRTDAFARIASASGSLWYPDFADYVRRQPWVRRPEKLYLSLGDREARTRNPMMRPVEDKTRALAAFYEAQGVPTVLEMNPGGHFNEPERRMARGIAWILEE